MLTMVIQRSSVFTFILGLTLLLGWLPAQAQVWEPAPGLTQIPIWPEGKVPNSSSIPGPETYRESPGLVAGKPWHAAEHVAVPTMTFYPAKGDNSGATVVIYPGGGYWVLAMDLEGTEFCDWLNSIGVNCVLLKYRVPGENEDPRVGPYPINPIALQDAQRSMSLVRQRAEEWKIDPNKIGVLGTSAGGHLAIAMSIHQNRVYEPVDEADELSFRPDFAVPIYPGHITKSKHSMELRDHIQIPRNAPPTLLIHAQNDEVDPVEYSLAYYLGLTRAGVPARMHIFESGGHAFGLRPSEAPVTTEWPQLTEQWLRDIGMIPTVSEAALKSVEVTSNQFFVSWGHFVAFWSQS